MKNFDLDIKTTGGVFVGIIHDDAQGHGWLAAQLDKIKTEISYFFIETNQANILAWKKIVTDQKFTKIPTPKQLFGLSNGNNIVFLFLCAIYLMKLNVIGIDEVSESDRLFLIQNRDNTDPTVVEKCLEIRSKSDPIMKKNIEAELKKKSGSYVILGGPMHYKLAESLKINSVILMEQKFSVSQSSAMKNHFNTLKLGHNIHIYDSDNKVTHLLYNKNRFFSPSQYATKDDPHGPYEDVYCSPSNPIVELGEKLSM